MRRLSIIACAGFLMAGASVGVALDVTATQRLNLKAGWNSIYLEVEPEEKSPDRVFADVPVDVAARYFILETPVQFISDPADEPWKRKGWGVWYAPEREDAFLSNLHAIQGSRCYLVHATEDAVWEVTGVVRPRRAEWKVGSFNLFGATIDEGRAPTFGAFFSGAGGRVGSRIYRLVDGVWEKVERSDEAAMRPGEACWVYCEGNSSYAGPLEVVLPGSAGLEFGSSGDRVKLEVRNTSGKTVDLRFEYVASTEGARLPIRYQVRSPESLKTSYPEFVAPLGFTGVEPGRSVQLELVLNRERMGGSGGVGLVSVSSSEGAIARVPIRADGFKLSNPE